MVREIQTRLLNHFRFGSGEDGAKVKVKEFAMDMNFLGIPIRDNADAFFNDTASTQKLIMLFDMGHITTIRNSCEAIKSKHESYNGEAITKADFQSQYIEYLNHKTRSRGMSVDLLKKLGSNMKDFNCPIGEHLNGYVMESSKLGRLQALSALGVMDTILESKNDILNYNK